MGNRQNENAVPSYYFLDGVILLSPDSAGNIYPSVLI